MEKTRIESLGLSNSDIANILKESGYPVNSENIDILKECINDNTVVLQEGKIRKFLRGARRSFKTVATTAAGGLTGLVFGGPVGGLIGAASGAGVGLADNAIEKAVNKRDDEDPGDLKESELSDFDLLCLLEENGYEPTLKNLEAVKAGLKDGTIVKSADIKETPEEKHEETIEPQKIPEKPIFKEVKKETVVPKKSHTEAFLKDYLIHDCDIPLREAESLSSEDKTLTMKELAKMVLTSLSDKMATLDTSAADRSRGDVRLLKFLGDLQNAITQLEAILERSDEYNPEAKKYLGTVVKSILYLNQYSGVFKEAYRNKKTLLILKYESLIMSIISATSYLMSQIVDFRSQTLEMKQPVIIEEIAPLKTLAQFNKSVESGEFKIITNDVTTLREFYKEIPVEDMSTLYEASDILSLVSNGIKSIYDGIDKNKITQLIYNATGIVVLLMSVRDAVYTLFRMKTKASDMINAIHNFANINMSGGIKALSSFANKFIPDVENASDMAKNEVRDDDRKLATQLNAIKAAPVLDAPEPVTPVDIPASNIGTQTPVQTQNNIFDF